MGIEEKTRLATGELRWHCDANAFGFDTTKDFPCCQEIFGQDRALNAIRLGLEITSPGFNIYVSGLTGTGKSTAIQQLLHSMRAEKPELFDLCYMHNFQVPECPQCACLPAGQGNKFKARMRDVLRGLKDHISQTLESESYTADQKAILEDLKSRRGALASELEERISEKGFRLLEVQYGPFTRPVIVPVVDGQPVDLDKLEALVEAGKLAKEDLERIHKDHEELVTMMEGFLRESRSLDHEMSERKAALDKRVISPIVDTLLSEVEQDFQNRRVTEYLRELREKTIENMEVFTSEGDDEKGDARDFFRVFEINVIVDNSRMVDTPIIIENIPNYGNLFGTIDRVSDGRGEYHTDHTRIRAGSLLRANGGFLVLNLGDLIEEQAVWPALKRALKNHEVTIQGFDSLLVMPVAALKPEPIKINVKVVLIGDVESYQFLYHYDEDFRKIFKVKADFDMEMPNTDDNLRKYGQFVRNLIDREGLRHFHKTAVAAIAEEGATIAGRRDRLSTRFSDVADVIRESNYWAIKDKAKVVRAKHVERAVAERIERANLIEEKLGEMLEDGIILLDIDGKKVGQVNGLAVYDIGDYAFGKPNRITVETSMGRAGIINIEREAELSGKTYNKGVLILEGYFRRMYAQDKPLTMSASICFEQSYSGVDGDSASSAELYGLLSSLSGLPLRQDLAVTGSVNQKGEIQPIGGVNEKIHGFFALCKAKGLTGNQGVIIPTLNKKDLMLRGDVLDAVRKGRFHVHAIGTIEEGIELLTGVRAGRSTPEGFEKDTVHELVDDKLAHFAEQLKEFSDGGEDHEDGE